MKAAFFGFMLAIGMPALGLVLAYALGARPTATVAATKTEEPAHDPTDHWATPEQHTWARRLILSEGYSCHDIRTMQPFAWSGYGWHVHCQNPIYAYEVEDHGGKWSVTPR